VAPSSWRKSGPIYLAQPSETGPIQLAGDNGSSIAFVSAAENLGALESGHASLMVRDSDGVVSVVTPTSWDGDVEDAVISGDGLHIAFTTAATGVVAGVGGGVDQVYVASRPAVGAAWSFELVSVTGDGSPFAARASGSSLATDNWDLTISGDGKRVGWLTASTNAEPAVTSSTDAPWLVLRDRPGGLPRWR